MLNKTVIQPIILAAGNGKRILAEATQKGLGELPKVLYPLHQKPLIDYVLASVVEVKEELAPQNIEFMKPIVVVKFMQEKVREHLGDAVSYVEQNPAPLGTGHAVLVTESAVSDEVDHVLVLNGDMPAWHPSTISSVLVRAVETGAALTLATVSFTDPTYTADFFVYGRMVRDEAGQVKKIVEQRDCTPTEQQISECNPSLYCFERDWLYSALHTIKNTNSQHEYYLTDLLQIAIDGQARVETVEVGDWREALGVNTLEQLQLAEKLI